MFEKIINQKSWIIEDVGRNKLKKGREKADIIYYLKISRLKSYYRVTKRWIKQRLGIERYNRPPTFGQLLDFISFVNMYFKKQPIKLKELSEYKEKFKVLKAKDLKTIYNTSLKPLKDNKETYELLHKWYKEKEVYSSFEQRPLSYDEIVKKYKPRTKENSFIKVFMIEYKNKPIGIVQYKKLKNEDLKLYKINKDNVYEIDIFIGNKKYRNKGIGKFAIDDVLNILNGNSAFVMLPFKDNLRAINCYKKCGFKESKELTLKDTIGNEKEYKLMIKEM